MAKRRKKKAGRDSKGRFKKGHRATKRRSSSKKRSVKRSASRIACPKRYKGKKVRSKRTKRGTICFIVKRNGQYRFVPKKKGKRGKRKR